jgi:hypothetical protein
MILSDMYKILFFVSLFLLSFIACQKVDNTKTNEIGPIIFNGITLTDSNGGTHS